jgi:hypothetical protein
LAIYWDAKYECGATVMFCIDGKCVEFDTDSSGNIVVTVDKLLEHPHMFIGDFIESLKIPEIRDLTVEGEKE